MARFLCLFLASGRQMPLDMQSCPMSDSFTPALLGSYNLTVLLRKFTINHKTGSVICCRLIFIASILTYLLVKPFVKQSTILVH